jgi:hypothetical protein
MDYGPVFGFQSVHEFQSEQNPSFAPISHYNKEYKGSILYLLVKGIIAVISMLFKSNLFSSLANRQITLNPPQNQKEILFSFLTNVKLPNVGELKQDLDRLNLIIDRKRIGNTYKKNENLSDDGRNANKEEMFKNLQIALNKFGLKGETENGYLRAAVNQAILSTHSQQVRTEFPDMHCKLIQGSISIVIKTHKKTIEQKTSYTIHDLDSGGAPVKEISKRVQVHSVADFRDPKRIKFKI